MIKFKAIPLYTKILIGMFVGLLIGFIAVQIGHATFVANWIVPFGEIFIRLLKVIAIPLVLISLIKGIGGLKDIAQLASMGVRTIAIYVITTVFAISIGIGLVLLIKPGDVINEATSKKMTESYAASMSSNISDLKALEAASPLQPLVDIFPENMAAAMGDNSAMLQIIFLAIIIGVAIVMVGEKKSSPFMTLVGSLDFIVLKIIDIVMNYAPIGVTALMAGLMVESAGDLSLLSALGTYAITVILGLGLLMFGFYPLLIKLFTKVKPLHFIRSMLPVQLVAFSTSSSAATLPTTLKVAEEKLKLPNRVTSFVLPVGVTINMDGTSCYQAIAVIFIAQVMGIDLSFTQILVVIATTTISSIGTPGIPGGSIVISMMVLTAIGVPPEGLAIILGIDRPLDMMRTAVNVTGDAAVAAIITEKEKVNA